MPRFKRGDCVRCIEAPDWLYREVSVGTEYVVNKIMNQHGAQYIRILGDDNRGSDLLSRLFVKTGNR